MITPEVYAAASRHGVSITVPELECDIDAQIQALLDPDHPKNCVFLARGNSLGDRKLPGWIFIEQRREGTLITDSAAMSAMFRTVDDVTDDLLAAMLGYPEAKADVMATGHALVAQALDQVGNVVWEAGCSPAGLDAAMEAAKQQAPFGGCAHMTTVEHALARRLKGKSN